MKKIYKNYHFEIHKFYEGLWYNDLSETISIYFLEGFNNHIKFDFLNNFKKLIKEGISERNK